MTRHIGRLRGGLTAAVEDEYHNNQLQGKTLRALFRKRRHGRKIVGYGSWQVVVIGPLHTSATWDGKK